MTLPLHSGQTHRSRHKLAQQKPTAMLIARHHANEVSSTNAVLALVRDLVDDPTQRDILARVNLVVLPLANPDGAAFHYQLMTEHPRWKHHAARFNAAGKEFSQDTFNPDTLFGEATFRRTAWSAWLPDAIVDNHGVPRTNGVSPSPATIRRPASRFRTTWCRRCSTASSPSPQMTNSPPPLRDAVSAAVAQILWLHERNQYWLNRYHTYGHRWSPDFSLCRPTTTCYSFFADLIAAPNRFGVALQAATRPSPASSG
ncbi:MAG: M14 family zinc carboxypeptidase [Caldilineaceae bacterium]